MSSVPVVSTLITRLQAELVKAPMAGGPNSVNFQQGMSHSDVSVVRVDLGPPIDPSQWREVRREKGERGPRDEANFAFADYDRRR